MELIVFVVRISIFFSEIHSKIYEAHEFKKCMYIHVKKYTSISIKLSYLIKKMSEHITFSKL